MPRPPSIATSWKAPALSRSSSPPPSGWISAEIESFRNPGYVAAGACLGRGDARRANAARCWGPNSSRRASATSTPVLRGLAPDRGCRLAACCAEITLADSGNLPFKSMVGVVANDLNDVEFYIAEVEPGQAPPTRGPLRTAVLDFRRHIQELRGLARSEQEIAWDPAALDDAFQQLGRTGVSLINGQDQQRAQFDHFTGQVSHLGQELLGGPDQPDMTGNLGPAWEDRLLRHAQPGHAVGSSLLSLLVVVAALASVAVMLRRINGRHRRRCSHGVDRVAVGDLQDAPVVLRSDDGVGPVGRGLQHHDGRDRRARAAPPAAHRLDQLERLREISLRLTSVLALDEVLQTVADSSLDLVLDAAEAHLFLCTRRRAGAGAYGQPCTARRTGRALRPCSRATRGRRP